MTTLEASVVIFVQIVTLVVAGLAAWRAWRADAKSEENNRIAQRLEVNVDGRLTQLLERDGELREALGIAKGEQRQRDRESGDSDVT